MPGLQVVSLKGKILRVIRSKDFAKKDDMGFSSGKWSLLNLATCTEEASVVRCRMGQLSHVPTPLHWVYIVQKPDQWKACWDLSVRVISSVSKVPVICLKPMHRLSMFTKKQTSPPYTRLYQEKLLKGFPGPSACVWFFGCSFEGRPGSPNTLQPYCTYLLVPASTYEDMLILYLVVSSTIYYYLVLSSTI